MTSDEIKQVSNSTKENLDRNDEHYIFGYAQGRADAWRWREYPKEKPDNESRCFVLCEYRGSHYPSTAWLNRITGLWEGINVDPTHWLPITLPGGEND